MTEFVIFLFILRIARIWSHFILRSNSEIKSKCVTAFTFTATLERLPGLVVVVVVLDNGRQMDNGNAGFKQ